MSGVSIDDVLQTVTAVAALGAAFLGRRNARKLNDVHDLVNGNAVAQDARVEQLSQTLHQAGVDVPPRPHRRATDEQDV